MCSVGGIPAHVNAIPTVHTAAHEVCSSLFSNHFWLFHFQRRRCQVSGKVEKEYKEDFSRTRLEYSPFRCGEIYVCVQTA